MLTLISDIGTAFLVDSSVVLDENAQAGLKRAAVYGLSMFEARAAREFCNSLRNNLVKFQSIEFFESRAADGLARLVIR